jgi:FkbM family methyltransferase
MRFDDFLLKAGISLNKNKIVLPENCKRVKIDVGLSYNAGQSARWLEEDPDLVVFGFEPVESNLNTINNTQEQSIYKYLRDRMFVLPVALGSSKGVFSMYITKVDTGRSSLLKPLNFDVDHIERVPQFTLNEFLDYFPFNKILRIDYLKTDCQGSDIEVLKGASRYLDRIAVITTECDDVAYELSNNSFFEVNKFLVKNGFTCTNTFFHSDPNNRVLKSRSIKSLKARIPVSFKNFVKRILRMNSKSEDPTFYNRRFIDFIREGEISYYQKG